MPNLMTVIADDSYGECLNEVAYGGTKVCVERRPEAKALHSLFFFGFPLSNVDPKWNGFGEDQGLKEAKSFMMDWIFAAYNDLLMAKGKEADGLEILFDA